jgi:hypothetical protein
MPRGRGPLLCAAFAACVSVAALAQAFVVHHGRTGSEHRSIAIRGSAHRLVYPGSSQRLNLRLRNRLEVPVLVTRIRVRVRVDRPHRRAGCNARDYRVRQLRRSAYPILLAPHGVRRLGRIRPRSFPRLRMVHAPTRNQDACKGAKLRLRYRARVVEAR